MTALSLKIRLERYLRANHGWIAKGTLCDIARVKTGATGEHTGRRLRELENDGVLEVQYRCGHAYYRVKQPETLQEQLRRSIEWFNQLPV